MEIKEKFDWFCKTTWSKSAYNTLWCLIGCSIGDFGTIYYFLHFLILLPLLGKFERNRPLPESIGKPVLAE